MQTYRPSYLAKAFGRTAQTIRNWKKIYFPHKTEMNYSAEEVEILRYVDSQLRGGVRHRDIDITQSSDYEPVEIVESALQTQAQSAEQAALYEAWRLLLQEKDKRIEMLEGELERARRPFWRR